MKVCITGSMTLGSRLYSQCLRDIMRLQASRARTDKSLEFLVDSSQAGLLAHKLLSAASLRVRSMNSELAIPQAHVVLVYVTDPEADAHFEQRAYDLQADEAEVYVRVLPKNPPPRLLRPPSDDPYADFKKAFHLVEKRIRPIPTRGPQLWREIEIRPNGGQPWFYV